jgi:hypothetical protein
MGSRASGIGGFIGVGRGRPLLAWIGKSAVIAVAAGSLAAWLPGLLVRRRLINRALRWVLLGFGTLIAVDIPLAVVEVRNPLSHDAGYLFAVMLGLLIASQTIAGPGWVPDKS